jgi:Family of unknown function (DUF6615)
MTIPSCWPDSSTSLCRSFAALAAETWSNLRDADRLGLQLGEESVTDFLLLDLKRFHRRSVVVRKFAKGAERQSGADWEWWFRASDMWFGARVQAKKLSTRRLVYEKLDYKPVRSRKRQIDQLIDDAQSRRLYPLYCFYNYWDTSVMPATSYCGSFPPQDEHFGCTVADAYAVRDRVSDPTLCGLLPLSLPWMCLVCCRGFSVEDKRLPARAYAVARDGLRSRALRTKDKAPPVAEPIDRPPQYVARLLEQRDDMIDELTAEQFGLPAELRGLLVIADHEGA